MKKGSNKRTLNDKKFMVNEESILNKFLNYNHFIYYLITIKSNQFIRLEKKGLTFALLI